MSIFEAIILGIIQGLSEFLPISSTAHLTLAGKLMGLISPDSPEKWTAFIAVIQLGTLAAVLVYFAKDIKNIIISFFKENLGKGKKKFVEQSLNSRMGWYVIIGSLPIMTIGLLLKKVIEGDFTKNIVVIAVSLIVLAVFLGIAELVAKLKKESENISWKDALIVGLAQCLALIPGASRSGTTITAGLFLGMKRETAARFSFLLSIPAVLASGLLEFYQSLKYLDSQQFISMGIATIFAAVSGLLTIVFLLKFLKSQTTWVFVIYRLIVGGLIFFLLYYNLIDSLVIK